MTTFVHSLDNARPPRRFDGLPYTHVAFEQAPDVAGAPGAFARLPTLIDLAALEGGLDADPAAPRYRDVTTTEATLAEAWLRLVWVRGEQESPPTSPRWSEADPSAGTLGLLATVADLKRYLRTQGTVAPGAALDEQLLTDLVAAASSRMIDQRPERTLEVIDEAELRFPILAGRRIVQVPDLRDVVSVTIGGRVLEPSAYTLRRRARELCAIWLKLASAELIDGELVIVGAWGPAGVKEGEPLEVRASVREAAIVWAARAFHNRTARYADTMQDAAGGVASYFRNLPPDVKATLDALEVPGA